MRVELRSEPQLGELTREFAVVEPAGRGLEQDSGREIDLVVNLVVNVGPDRRLAIKSARNEAGIGAIVVRFRAEREQQRQAIIVRVDGRRVDNRSAAPASGHHLRLSRRPRQRSVRPSAPPRRS